MNQYYPRIRITAEDGFMYMREALSLSFYLAAPHRSFAPQMMRTLERYAAVIGPAFGALIDDDGETNVLDEASWERIRNQMLDPEGTSIRLTDVDWREERYRFDYGAVSDSRSVQPNAVNAMRCWFPTEYLEEHGPEHLRALALEMLGSLPICAGNLGLSVRILGFGENRLTLRQLALRYPGFSLNDIESVMMHVGTRVPDLSWVTFLGQPALGEMGGVASLRSRLHSPGTTVEELPGDRAVITLGEWPDAGDMEQGRTLPAYRELARVLEPVLYREQRRYWSWHYASPEELRRVERRFLDLNRPNQHFFVRLIPPRPTFPMDMNDEEKRLMGEHAAYLREHFDAGRVLTYGPVMAAGGPFGMAVFEVEDEAEARRIMDGDPTVRAGLNRYELSPMRLGAARGSVSG